MNFYFYIASAIVALQAAFLILAYRNYRYALNKYRKKRTWYRPRTALIIPCKGLDADFEKNIASFFHQDYENYLLYFVVGDKADHAYEKLHQLKQLLSSSSKAVDVRILVAGQAASCSQKIHNLLYCYHNLSCDTEILAFADSDACVRSDWLSHIVYPLRKAKIGAASGYRWFIPQKNNSASLALSAINARVAQLLGNTPFNKAWGGSMAIRYDVFQSLGLDKIWPTALSDDLSLSYTVKKAKLKIAFVPACLVASYQSAKWRQLFEFGRRQFIITRVNAPLTWWFGFCSSLYSVLALWATLGVAVYQAALSRNYFTFFTAVPFLVLAGQILMAAFRQKTAVQLLNEYSRKMTPAVAADIFLPWAWSLVLLAIILSSAFGRTIKWRGIRYKLLSPTQTVVIGR